MLGAWGLKLLIFVKVPDKLKITRGLRQLTRKDLCNGLLGK